MGTTLSKRPGLALLGAVLSAQPTWVTQKACDQTPHCVLIPIQSGLQGEAGLPLWMTQLPYYAEESLT